jgi:hypothetical protein
VAATAFGWLLGSPGSTETPDVAAAEATTTTVAAATTTTVVTTTTLPAADPLGVTAVPLSALVPGFSDTILFLTTPVEEINVAAWPASQTTPEAALSIERDDAHLTGGWPIGLDVSGSWFAQILGDGVLTVHPIADDEAAQPGREAVGLRVGSAVWHSTEPGRLAWLACARSTPGPATLTTVDLTDPASEPVTVSSLPQGCTSDRDEWVVLESWEGEALVVSLPRDRRSEPVLIDVDSGDILAEPDEPVLVENADGRYYRSVPGAASDELVVSTAWSPDGRQVAVNLTPQFDRTASLVRIVDAATGAIVSERDGNGSGVITMTWSTDSRFLLYTTLRSAFNPGLPGPLVIHDVTTDVVTTVSMSRYVDEIRTRTASSQS